MGQINAPNRISCGLGGVYHRKTNPKPWRCRTCGSEFSDDDLRQKQEDLKRAREEFIEWANERTGGDGHILDLFRDLQNLKNYETRRLGRKLTRSELFAIDRELSKYPYKGEHDGTPGGRIGFDSFDKVVKPNAVNLKPQEKPGDSVERSSSNSLWWILALLVIGAIIGYAC
jgi:hypothetical protein